MRKSQPLCAFTNRMRRLVLASTLMLAGLPTVGWAQSIQPGDAIDLGCTLGWLFDGGDGVAYFSTAAHCVTEPQQAVHLSSGIFPATTKGERLGQVRMVGDKATAATDAALIAVEPGLRPRTLGTMRGHDRIPTGSVSPLAVSVDATLQMSGYGYGFDATSATREGRQGTLRPGSSAHAWEGLLPQTGGDSGGPVADAADGRAMGLVKGARANGTGQAGSWGPTVAAVVDLARRNGIQITLRLAGQGPPPPAPPPPAISAPAHAAPARSGPSSAAYRRKAAARKRSACRRKAQRIKRSTSRRRALRRCTRFR